MLGGMVWHARKMRRAEKMRKKRRGVDEGCGGLLGLPLIG